uniref:Apical junction component 1 homolog n=1 Tax=Latimeria chalumnae TaxID=7897 RepID=H3A985_LATCH
MTRTDPPDILVSTVYQDIKVNPAPTESKSCRSVKQCDNYMSTKLEKNLHFNKRHCRSFDFLESLDDQQALSSSISKPNLHGVESNREPPKAEPKRRSRSKSAPRVKTTFTPVPIEVSSPPTVRRGREALRVPREPQKRTEVSPKRDTYYVPMKAMMNEVHPIKLQPQRSNSSRYSPLYISDCFDENQNSMQPGYSPHVKCRVDIKPDESVLQHTTRNLKAPQSKPDGTYWQRHPSGVRNLSVPNSRQVSISRTPTPSDSYSGDHGVMYQNIPLPREYRDYPIRDQRTISSPRMPPNFFYSEDQSGVPNQNVAWRTAYSEEQACPVQRPNAPSKNLPRRILYAEQSRTYPIPTIPSRTFFSDDSQNYTFKSIPNKPFIGVEHRSYPVRNIPSTVFYTEGHGKFAEQEDPSRVFSHPRTHAQPLQFSEWYSSDWGMKSRPNLHLSQFPPPQTRKESLLSPWDTSFSIDHHRLATETRAYSKSWDNIIIPTVHRDDRVVRGHSYENLLSQGRQALSSDERRQPVVVNLSSSPKRYAALSLSENSILEKVRTDGGRNSIGRSWFVTPEITITDNDIKTNGSNKVQNRSAGWNILDRKSTKENVYNSSTLQRSLEQLDELIADLVIDYKPPASRRPSEADALEDQLRKLINEEETESTEKQVLKKLGPPTQPRPRKEQPGRTVFTTDVGGEVSGCSPDLSADEDDMMMCSNAKCRRTETMFNACLYFKSCHSCYTYYCSRNCRREDWDHHKESCIYGRIGSICRHVIKFCRENLEVHKAFSRIAKVGYLSRGRGVLFLGFPNPGSSENFLQFGLESLLMSPTYLSLRELERYSDNLGEYSKELQEAGNQYDPDECFLLNVSVAVGKKVPERPSPKLQVPTIRKYAKVALASSSPEKKILKKENDMETLILTPPPGTTDIDKEGEEGRKAREVCFINIQRELRIRGVFLRHEFPKIYEQLCEFVESNKRFTPTTIYPIDKRTGKQFMCMIMAASEPRTLDWVASPNLLDDIM